MLLVIAGRSPPVGRAVPYPAVYDLVRLGPTAARHAGVDFDRTRAGTRWRLGCCGTGTGGDRLQAVRTLLDHPRLLGHHDYGDRLTAIAFCGKNRTLSVPILPQSQISNDDPSPIGGRDCRRHSSGVSESRQTFLKSPMSREQRTKAGRHRTLQCSDRHKRAVAAYKGPFGSRASWASTSGSRSVKPSELARHDQGWLAMIKAPGRVLRSALRQPFVVDRAGLDWEVDAPQLNGQRTSVLCFACVVTLASYPRTPGASSCG
jgi:hypothetical protein